MNKTSALEGGKGENRMEKAILAGGCFWCMESDFEKVPGVKEVVSGYAGGTGINPTYEDYAAKGHIEVVEISYDPSVISYKKILDIFWHNVDPLDAGGQFCDRGYHYSTAIYYHSAEQKKLAEESKKALDKSGKLGKPAVTPIVAAGKFYPAEEYHQGYYKKNPLRYKYYRTSCGRDRRLKELWGAEAKTAGVSANKAGKYGRPDDATMQT
ncbi:MAG: peptide-methionine (S)-S-oxide reductase MsrA [Nitrospinota bacterium]